MIVFDAHGEFLKSWGENEFPGRSRPAYLARWHISGLLTESYNNSSSSISMENC